MASSEGGRWRSTASDWRGRRAGLEWPPSTVRPLCSHLMLCARKPTNPHVLQIPKITLTWRNWLQTSTINSRSTPTQYSCVWFDISISPEHSRYNVQIVKVTFTDWKTRVLSQLQKTNLKQEGLDNTGSDKLYFRAPRDSEYSLLGGSGRREVMQNPSAFGL